ncbi:trafficking protein particle complex subunit 12 isoform X1 [Musca domestica]|uniref:Trafficking protein particle complex subunit 12 isoform X1 n=2 Tax=Musca domestica TaxID=7370 RepID=A0A1I8N0H4_MUSDO|nr:trafficking protein particle complex subunit 12 isoform X1 [Musca domestica]
MENKGVSGQQPSLSQYFANDPPSFFDELASSKPQQMETVGGDTMTLPANPQATQQTLNTNQVPLMGTTPGGNTVSSNVQPAAASTGVNLTSNTFTGGFKTPEYIENQAELEEDMKIADDVRNFWETPVTPNGHPPLLTTPGIQTATDLPDLIANAVSKHLGDAELGHRKIPGVDNVTQDERGLRSLIASGCYRSAINLTGRLLTIYGQGYGRAGQPAKHSPHSLQLWFTRLALLAKLGEYELLQKEAEPFDKLNKPDVFYEFYPEMYPGKTGSIACFSFRLLLAEMPIYLGNPQLALDRLSELYVITNEIKLYFAGKNMKEAQDFWKKREFKILHAIVNCAIILKKYNLIDDILRSMIADGGDLDKEERRALFSAWGRIYLQIGDVFGAEQKFAEARRLRKIYSQPDIRDLVDKGLITVAQNDFPEAYATFQKALHLESGNTMILNNMGVCLLYAGKLKEAITLFERAINLNPQKSLNESLLVNLSTLYELESNNSKNKKLNLLRLINRYKPDLNISLEICLKLQTPN